MDALFTPILAFGIGGFGGPELIVLVVLVVLLFGGRKIPELMRGLGSGVKEFRQASKEIQEPLEEAKSAVKDAVDPKKADT